MNLKYTKLGFLAIASLGLGLSSCGENPATEEVADDIEDAADDATDSVDDAIAVEGATE